jgi:hypothetical protein
MNILKLIFQGGLAGLLCAAAVIGIMHLFQKKDGDLSPYATRSALLSVWLVGGLLYIALAYR